MAGRYRRVNVEQLREIMAVNFALLETILYLNTHPADEAVMELYNRFARRLMELIRDYQENYSLLVPHLPGEETPWRWIEEPWPWQIDY
ncbi:MAG: spore coat protein CotJB [Halanaerobiaceae bacterium]